MLFQSVVGSKMIFGFTDEIECGWMDRGTYESCDNRDRDIVCCEPNDKMCDCDG